MEGIEKINNDKRTLSTVSLNENDFEKINLDNKMLKNQHLG